MSKEIDNAEIIVEMKRLRDENEKLKKDNEVLQATVAASIYLLKILAKGD